MKFPLFFEHLWIRIRHVSSLASRRIPYFWPGVLVIALIIILAGALLDKPTGSTPPQSSHPQAVEATDQRTVDYTIPAREIPRSFRPGSQMPRNKGEGAASGSIEISTFDPDRDLIRIDDPRVKWESDDDKNDNEDDHLYHRSLEAPLRRLIHLVEEAGGELEVTDGYRDKYDRIHAKRSLHKEGRAIDLISTGIDLSHLGRLAWAAGFDWVLYESGKGAHIHASVRRIAPENAPNANETK